MSHRVGLTLGVDLEEIYEIFGEGFQTLASGLPAESFELAERKVARVRSTLLDVGCPSSQIRQFDDAASHLHRIGDPFPHGVDFDGFASLNMSCGARLSALMGEIAGALPAEQRPHYDVGIMLTRFALCLRVVRAADGVESEVAATYAEMYARELHRVTPLLAGMLRVALDRAEDASGSEVQIRRELGGLDALLETRAVDAAAWRAEAAVQVASIFDALGTIGIELLPPASFARLDESEEFLENDFEEAFDEEELQIVDSLAELRGRVLQLFEAGDLESAEAGQRLLIDDCRATIGADHPLTLAVRGELCITLLARGRGELALGLALDLQSDAEEWHGPRDAATVRACVLVLFVLMTTREFDESSRYYEEQLTWLAEAEPGSLDDELQRARTELLELIGRS